MATSGKTVNVLVVGDWVIDENWILANFESDLSTHVGKHHLRSMVNEVNTQVLNLCGAGNIARSLHGLSKHEADRMEGVKKTIQVFGLGLWHPKDTKLLASLFSADTFEHQTPLTLSSMSLLFNKKRSRYSLCGKRLEPGICHTADKDGSKFCKAKGESCQYLRTLYCENLSEGCGTTRVIRIYKEPAGGYPEHILRIDWERPSNVSQAVTPSDKVLKSLFKPPWKKMAGIIVNDLHKGCISKPLIEILSEKYPDAIWFVRTKDMGAEWIESIPSEKLRLRMIGAEYIPERSKTKRWFYDDNINIEAVKELEKLGLFHKIKDKKNIERWVIGLHHNNRVIALHKKQGSNKTIGTVTISPPTQKPINVGRSSIFFASAIASILGCYEDCSDKTMLKRASIHASNWTKRYSENIQNISLQDTVVSENPLSHIDAIKAPLISKDIHVQSCQFDVTKIKKSWETSFKNSGIIENEFHLWRGYSCIEDYITTRFSLQDELNKLYQTVNEFRNNKQNKTSLNCLILGDPGWGKTFLAEKIAQTFDLNPILFNLSQLTTIDEVIDCFDTISSIQNLQKRKPVLAFFDEMDSELSGQYVFSLFLSPILDGTYRRGGRIFYLAPCIWMFAGARSPLDIKNANKTADFMSRINGPIVRLDFGTPHKNHSQAMTEQVYLGVKLILNNFEDVTWVSRDILYLFKDLEMKHGVRSFEQAIRKFRNLQYGKVGRRNLPDHEEIKHLVSIDKKIYNNLKNKTEPEDFIEIKKEPTMSSSLGWLECV